MRVRFVIHIHELLNAGLRVTLRRRERDMAEQFLDRAKVCAIRQQMRGESVAERVGMKVPIDIGKTRILLDDVGSSRVDLQACKLEYSIVSPK